MGRKENGEITTDKEFLLQVKVSLPADFLSSDRAKIFYISTSRLQSSNIASGLKY